MQQDAELKAGGGGMVKFSESGERSGFMVLSYYTPHTLSTPKTSPSDTIATRVLYMCTTRGGLDCDFDDLWDDGIAEFGVIK